MYDSGSAVVVWYVQSQDFDSKLRWFRGNPSACSGVTVQFNLQTISYRTVLLNKFTYVYRWYSLCEGESAESSGFFNFCSENAVLGLHISWYQIILNSHRYLNAYVGRNR